MMTLNATLTIPCVKLHTTTKLPRSVKEYFCFRINDEYSQADNSVKYRIMNKFINYIFPIDKF